MRTQNAKISQPDVSGITYKQTRNPHNSAMKRVRPCQAQTVLGAIAVAMVAMGFYQVRELVAALIIFSILFGTLGMALLILFLIQELALKGVAHVESRVAYIRAHHAAAPGQD